MLNLFKNNIAIGSKGSFKRLNFSSTCYFSTAEKPDYYKILGVDKNADQKQIKAEFYKLAKQYHPDVSKGFEDKFKQINEAYEILSDDSLRTSYDNHIKTGGNATNFTGSSHANQSTSTSHGPGSARYYSYGRSNYKNSQQSYSGQSYSYGFKDSKTDKQRTASGQSYYSKPDNDFDSFYEKFMRDFGSNVNSDEFRKRVYEEIKRGQEEFQYKKKADNAAYAQSVKRLKLSLLYVFGGAAVLVLGAALTGVKRSDREYVIMDETTDIAYITDERTYKEWLRKGKPSAERFFAQNKAAQESSNNFSIRTE